MKKISIIFFFLCLSQNLYSQSGWSQQNSGVNSLLYSIYILDSNTIYIVGGSGTILKTTNGGNNWIIINLGISSTLRSVYFLNLNTGFISGDNHIFIKTTNGGINWNNSLLNHTRATDIIFFNSLTGYIACSEFNFFPQSIVSKTTDGGLSWYDVNSWTEDWWGLYFCDLNNGYSCGFNSIHKTTNGGVSWFDIGTNTYFDVIFNFLNKDTGYISSNGTINGPPYSIRKTYDGGGSWVNIYQSNNPYVAGYFVNCLTGYIAGSNILKTTNGGINWYTQWNLFYAGLFRMKFLNQQTGFAIGNNGIILKTTNGGEPIGIKKFQNDHINSFSLSQNYPNPFNPTTKIKFDIPSSTLTLPKGEANVSLKIYDILGREVATLVNEELKPGSYEYEWDGSKYSSGVYFYRLQTKEFSQTKKLVLLK